MSGLKPDISKLRLNGSPNESPSQSPHQAPENRTLHFKIDPPSSKGGSTNVGAPGSASTGAFGSDSSPLPHEAHLVPASSSLSVNSLSSTQGSRNSSRSSSKLELKRFFGKGRTKHDSGVSSAEARGEDHHHHHKHAIFGGLFSKHKKKDKKNKEEAQHAANEVIDPVSIVHGKPPADLDPNLVVHGPDYDGDWDPFHVFGEEQPSERMPFLESGITKYGELVKTMGSGAGGNVTMMERPSDHKVFAVKEFRPRRANESPQKYAKHVTAEFALGAAFHHKNIIETIDMIKEGDRYFEVMEYGPFDFFEVVMSGSMTTPQIDSSFHQIVSGVAYLHSMGVAHRDLKLDNCVVTAEGVVKIIDFGSAIVFQYPMSPQIHLARGILGSDPYLAPEVFKKQPYQPQIADVWSCGIIYCCSYLRRFPWKLPLDTDQSFHKFAKNSENVDGLHPRQENAQKITGPWRLLRLLPRSSRPIIRKILTIDVKTRATVKDIAADNWFSNIAEISVLPPKADAHIPRAVRPKQVSTGAEQYNRPTPVRAYTTS